MGQRGGWHCTGVPGISGREGQAELPLPPPQVCRGRRPVLSTRPPSFEVFWLRQGERGSERCAR